MADLPTNYFDDILSESMNGKKKFRLTYRNGTTEEVTIEDISEYDQYGSKFGAGDINKINQAVNEKFDSDDVVDPMLTTEKGFAADAYKTKVQLEKVQSDLEQVFQLGANRKAQIISSLQNTNLGLTIDSSWDEIIAGIASLFPDIYDILANSYGKWSTSANGASLTITAEQFKWNDSSDSSTNHQLNTVSSVFDVTNYNSLALSYSWSTVRTPGSGGPSGGSAGCKIVLTNPAGNVELISKSATNNANVNETKTFDISNLQGKSTIQVTGHGSYRSSVITINLLKLSVEEYVG